MTTMATHSGFSSVLFERAEEYFKSRLFGQYASPAGLLKSMIILLAYIAGYIYFIFYTESFQQLLWGSVFLGLCHVLVPVNIAHDAIHNSISKPGWVNAIGRSTLELTGANAFMYSKKHLEAHSNKENGSKTSGIETQGLLIQQKKNTLTRNLPYLFYVLYAQYMIYIRDFILFFTSDEKIPLKEFFILIASKALYACAFLVLPFLFIDLQWWQILCGVMLIYFIVTVLLVVILLMPTERMESGRITDNRINETWIIEILEHNVDFSPGNSFLNNLVGGANLNVVHYLFPGVNHVHYNTLAAIIEQTTKEYGLQYRVQNVTDVFGIHFNYLKNIHEPDVSNKATASK